MIFHNMTPAVPPLSICRHFLLWQCQLRQESVRLNGGRPSSGMRPEVMQEDGGRIASAITVLIVETGPQASTETFRHIVRRTHDPRQRHEAGLRLLSERYYQRPEHFSGVLTALFHADAAVAAELVGAMRCRLGFEQAGQGFRVPCQVAELPEDDPAYQATYWHNHMFNPTPPLTIRMLAFYPDWGKAEEQSRVQSPGSRVKVSDSGLWTCDLKRSL